MRKFMLIVLFIAATACFLGAATSAETDQAQVTTEKGSLNLRSQPEKDATILDRIPNGSIVTVVAQDDVFWEIKYGNTQGYAIGKFLTPIIEDGADTAGTAPAALPPSDTKVENTSPQAGIIAQVTTEVGPLNLRKQANGDATVLAHIPNRSLVKVISQDDVFWKLSLAIIMDMPCVNSLP